MAEILIAAQNLPSGYRRGDIICAMPDGHVWGASEGLPMFVQVAISGLDVEVARSRITELYEDAQFGDPEFNSPDEADRRIRRHRRRVRVIWQELPQAVRNELQTTGRYETTLKQVRQYIRRLRYNRLSQEVEETTEEDF